MRLIDADETVNEIAELIAHEWGYEGIEEDVKRIFDEQQTVDAVPVVRCKDCEHKHINYFAKESMIVYCTLHDMSKQYDDFCSYGERRGD